jgi:hypothetical protein
MNWISVEDELPTIRKLVLWTDGHKMCLGLMAEQNMFLGMDYYIKSQTQCNVYFFRPLHWIPIPKIPEL